MDDLEFVLRMINEAQSDIEQLKGDLEDVKEKTEETEDANEGAGASFTELNSAIGVARQALQLIQGAYDQSIGKTLEYADTVRSLSRTIGATPEEASKLIQVADDVGVSQEALTAALETAIRKGVSPTIAGLGDLAEKYRAIESPIERSKFLMDTFGRSGNELAAIMLLDKQRIEEMGASAEATGQVINQKVLNETRALEVSLDNLADKAEGFTIKLSSGLIPVLTESIDLYLQTSDRMDRYRAALDSGIITQEQFNLSFASAPGHASEMQAAINEVEIALSAHTEQVDAQVIALSNWRDESDRSTASLWANVTATEAVAEANTHADDTLAILKLNMQGAIGNELQNFAAKQTELKDKAEEYRVKIAELNEKPYLTQVQREELAETQQGLSDVNRALEENATAHELATKRILLSILEQRLAIGGFTDEEAIFLQDMAIKWGLVDKATAEASKAIIKAVGDAGTSPNWEVLGKEVDHLAIRLLNLPRDIVVNVKINSPAAGDVGLGGDAPLQITPTNDTLPTTGGFSEGGSFTVPGTGSGDRPYLVPLEPGERVSVTPRGQASALDDSRSVTIIQNIYSPMDYEQAVNEIVDIIKRQ